MSKFQERAEEQYTCDVAIIQNTLKDREDEIERLRSRIADILSKEGWFLGLGFRSCGKSVFASWCLFLQLVCRTFDLKCEIVVPALRKFISSFGCGFFKSGFHKN